MDERYYRRMIDGRTLLSQSNLQFMKSLFIRIPDIETIPTDECGNLPNDFVE